MIQFNISGILFIPVLRFSQWMVSHCTLNKSQSPYQGSLDPTESCSPLLSQPHNLLVSLTQLTLLLQNSRHIPISKPFHLLPLTGMPLDRPSHTYPHAFASLLTFLVIPSKFLCLLSQYFSSTFLHFFFKLHIYQHLPLFPSLPF